VYVHDLKYVICVAEDLDLVCLRENVEDKPAEAAFVIIATRYNPDLSIVSQSRGQSGHLVAVRLAYLPNNSFDGSVRAVWDSDATQCLVGVVDLVAELKQVGVCHCGAVVTGWVDFVLLGVLDGHQVPMTEEEDRSRVTVLLYCMGQPIVTH
jgi:hypothetical protein